MKVLRKIKLAFSILFLALVLGCGSESIVFFIVGISATWQDVDDPNHRIELRWSEENEGMESGIFTGREQHDTEDVLNDNLISGMYDGVNVAFTILRRKADPMQEVTYTGTMDTIMIHPDTAQVVRFDLFSEEEGSLILEN